MKTENKKTLLLVEDEALIALATQDKLEKYGYNVLTAIKGESAVELSEKNDEIDLILMDIDLGRGMDGTEAAELILKKHNIPVVFLSSHMEPEIVKKTEKITSYGYVVKSSSITVLDASIKMAFKLFEADAKHRKAETELLNSEKRFRDIAENMADWIWEVDIDGRYTYCTDRVESILGYSPKEIIGKTPFDLMSPEESERIGATFKEHIMAVKPLRNLENWNITKDGRRVCLLTNGTPLVDKEGNCTGYRGVDSDITERKQSEEKLRNTEANLKNTFNISPGIICTANADTGYIIECNPAVYRILGYSVVEFTSRPFIEFIHPDDRQRTIDEMTKQLMGSTVVNFENRYYCKDGSYKWLAWQATAADINKKVYAVATDITKLKQTEEVLHIKDFVFNSALSAESIASNEGFLTHANPAFVSIWGYKDVDEVIGKPILDFLVDKDEAHEIIESINTTGKWEGEYTALKKDGSTFNTRSSANAVYDAEGKQIALYSSCVDITEYKRMEEILRENEEKFRIIADFTNDSEYWITPEGELVYQSPSIETITGYKAQEFYENHPDLFSSIIHPDDRGKFQMNFPKGEKDNTVSVFRIITKEGNVRWIENISRPVYLGEGKYIGVRGSSRDVTDRKLTEEKIEYLLTEKEMLLKEVHHRIKNNMNVMKSLLNLQSGKIDNFEAKAAFQDAIARITSMEVLYDKLYRTEVYVDISIKDYISQLIDEILGIFPNRGDIKIEKHLADFTISARIVFSLGIIVNELLTNAMKYAFTGRDSGLIQISTFKKDNRVTFIFEDNGVGMPEMESNEKSKGFGLKLIDLLTEQIDGSYEIERTNGTKFIIEFEP